MTLVAPSFPLSIEVTAFAYPSDESVLSATFYQLTELFQLIGQLTGYAIDGSVIDARSQSHEYAAVLDRFLGASLRGQEDLDVTWLAALNWVIRYPTDEAVINSAEGMLGVAADEARAVIRDVGAQPRLIASSPKALFVALRGYSLRRGGPWGVSYLEYPIAVAIETTGHRESVFHECLHQFGVSEGYDVETKATLSGCEGCWMQYQATKGIGLCLRHQDELRLFLQKVVPSD